MVVTSQIKRGKKKKRARDGGNWMTILTNKTKKNPKHNKKTVMPLIFLFERSNDWQLTKGYSCDLLDLLLSTWKQIGVYAKLQRDPHHKACVFPKRHAIQNRGSLWRRLCCSTGTEICMYSLT